MRAAGPADVLTIFSADADRRSVTLLNENLAAAQREQYARLNHFDVIGGESGKRYRIHLGDTMNVDELDSAGRWVSALCFGLAGNLPCADTMLAQKIALELFERDALTVANSYDIYDVPPRPSTAMTIGPEEARFPINIEGWFAWAGDRVVTRPINRNSCIIESGFDWAGRPESVARILTGSELKFDHEISYRDPDHELVLTAQTAAYAGLRRPTTGRAEQILVLGGGRDTRFVGFADLSPGQRATVISTPTLDAGSARDDVWRLVRGT